MAKLTGLLQFEEKHHRLALLSIDGGSDVTKKNKLNVAGVTLWHIGVNTSLFRAAISA